jgi:nucleotide-binding universal stress UspA family protein
MPWKRILAGVDDSPQAAAAAALGVRLAHALGGECILVHAVREFWLAFAEEEIVERSAELRAALVDSARRHVAEGLRGHVPEDAIRSMMVRPGSPAAVLRDVARELDAEAVILGGKHHATLRRWVGGRTAHNCVRSIGLPVLVTGPRAGGGGVLFRRILAAVDLSEAASPTAAAAGKLAAGLGAELRGLSVIELPLPLPDVTPPLTASEYSRLAERTLVRRVWPLFRDASVETIARPGRVLETIHLESTQWGADLLVVGSHGKGWGERLILGSVTEQLLSDLPTSLLVVPVHAPRPRLRRAAARKTARAPAGA